MFDLAGTGELARLFAVPREARDTSWLESFFSFAWTASVEIADPPVFVGPDGLPYLRLNVPSPGPFESQCLANVARTCLENLTGAAFFAGPDEPVDAAQYVLSLGLIDSLLTFDSPDGDPVDVAEAAEEPDPGFFAVERTEFGERLRVEKDHAVLSGRPSLEYLPPAQARALYRHLTEGWGLADPRVFLIADAHMSPSRSLVIGRKRSEFPPDAPVDAMMGALSWNLYPGRKFMLMPEDWHRETMAPLTDYF